MEKGEGKRSRRKCLVYIAAFIVFQTAIILVFALTVMRIKSPKVRFDAIAVENINFSNSSSSPSFNMRLQALFSIKNTNFGHFKYGNSTVTVLYNGLQVGDAVVFKGRARARKTKKFNISLDISSDRLSGNTNLSNDIGLGVLTFTSSSKLSGKIHLMKVIKKKKSGQMDCRWVINLHTREIQNLQCK